MQVRRMLRLEKGDAAAVRGFQKLHAKAKKEGFGRLLRSPTVWEDLVKCILLCNCGWVFAYHAPQDLMQAVSNWYCRKGR